MPADRLRRGVGSLVVAVLLATTTGCGNPVHLITGGDRIDDYCAALNGDRARFADMIGQDSPVGLLDATPMFESLASKAPDDIVDDWQTLLLALRGLQKELDDAGVKASDFADGRAPASLDKEARRRIAIAADQVSAQTTADAVDAIDQEARDVCKINLGL